MNLAKRLYELQQIDSEIQHEHETLDEISRQLGESEALLEARVRYTATTEHLAELEKQKRDMEWQVEELRQNSAQVNYKLYGGKIKNPKELVSLEQELGIFKTSLGQKEDELLDLMGAEEATNKKISSEKASIEKMETDWRQEQEVLTKNKADAEERLVNLNKKREDVAAEIDSESLKLYEGIKLKKGLAVVRVEQGRCQGCRINLPMSEWQRVRTGNLVQCGSCGKILHLG